MKFLKLIAGIGTLIVLVLMTASFLLPRKISVAKSVPVQSGGDCPMEMVLRFDNWPRWFPAIKDSISSLKILSEKRAELQGDKGSTASIELYGTARDSFGFTITGKSGLLVQFAFFLHAEKGGDHRLDLVVNTEMAWYPWERLKGVFIDKLAGPMYLAALENIVKACHAE